MAHGLGEAGHMPAYVARLRKSAAVGPPYLRILYSVMVSQTGTTLPQLRVCDIQHKQPSKLRDRRSDREDCRDPILAPASDTNDQSRQRCVWSALRGAILFRAASR
jgi:hypothetical protein